jgi:hypothetical protein
MLDWEFDFAERFEGEDVPIFYRIPERVECLRDFIERAVPVDMEVLRGLFVPPCSHANPLQQVLEHGHLRCACAVVAEGDAPRLLDACSRPLDEDGIGPLHELVLNLRNGPVPFGILILSRRTFGNPSRLARLPPRCPHGPRDEDGKALGIIG